MKIAQAKQGSHSLEKSLNFIVNPWKVLDCQKSLKSPWIPLYGLEKSLNFPQHESEASQQSCIVKIRVFFRVNFVKKTNKKNCKELCYWERQSRTRAKMWADTRSAVVYMSWNARVHLCMPHGAGLTLWSWSVCVGVCFAAKCLESAVLTMHGC